MTDRQIDGLDVYIRGKVERNSRGFNTEHTVSVQGRAIGRLDSRGEVYFDVPIGDGVAQLSEILDTLHQEADAANQREIKRQQREQLAAIQAGH